MTTQVEAQQSERVAEQQPDWAGHAGLPAVTEWLHAQDALVAPSEAVALRRQVGDVAQGGKVLLLAGDCVEPFSEFDDTSLTAKVNFIGDLARTLAPDDQGSVVKVGRMAEILAIDGVTEAAVFVASVDEAPSLVALIVTSDPPTSADPGTLWEAIAQRMRGKRAPDVVHLVGELPHLSGGGKLARRTIREEWRQLIRTSEAPESHRPEAVEAVVADG